MLRAAARVAFEADLRVSRRHVADGFAWHVVAAPRVARFLLVEALRARVAAVER